ncbi:protein far1-related sequence 5-like [Stylonychia lemnae]|uniref:Protein far1-related sequence 5-like n=1 Tax=Stylonychia lemnae TaxID=5949 RepID=A0A078AI96_STYLE|nr:protein far1-related sequence 5-like [Stylonychia lemnae]|eukprot:CDW80528.1 protein far1-related sequence 5-like [Stylonychia lemnae]
MLFSTENHSKFKVYNYLIKYYLQLTSLDDLRIQKRNAVLMADDVLYVYGQTNNNLGAYEPIDNNNPLEIKGQQTIRYFLKEMDYKHLECIILTHQIDQQFDLVQVVNKEWANSLGFSLKVKRPAKINKDSSKTLRLYCSHHNSKYTREDIEMIENESGLKEESCFFGLTFRYIPQNNIWMLYEIFDKHKMYHSHPFFYSFSNEALFSARQVQQDQTQNEMTDISAVDQNLSQGLEIIGHKENPDQNLTKKYYQIYRTILEKMSSMNSLLQQKASGQMIPTRKGTFLDGKYTSQVDMNSKRKKRMKSQSKTEENNGKQRKVQDFRVLVEKLVELKTADPNSLDYNTTRHPECQARIINLYYQTKEMKQNYEFYQDFVFINKRLCKTRFKRNIILFSGVNFEGKTLIFGVALIKEDDIESYQFAVQSFLNSIESKEPQVIIIERQSMMKNAIEPILKQSSIKLLYCYQHLYKSLKFQIRNMTYNKPFNESIRNILLRVEKLPKLENQNLVEKEILECMKLSETIKNECAEINIIVNKLNQERKYWCKYLTIKEFTAGTNVYQRVEFMKLWLSKHLLKRESNLEKTINLIIDFSWIDRIHNAQQKQLLSTQNNVYKQLGANHDKEDKNQEIERITYEEFRITKSQIIDREPILSEYILKNLSLNAYERCKYSIGQGLKYLRIIKEDKGFNKRCQLFIVNHVNPNQNKENLEANDRKLQKIKVFDEFAFCTCFERFNTGLPCQHEFLIALKRHKKLLFSERWFKGYEDQVKKNKQVVQKLIKQNRYEQQYVFKQMTLNDSKSKDIYDCIKEEDIRIDMKKDRLENFGEETWLGKSWLFNEGCRIYQNDSKRACYTELNENDVANVEFVNQDESNALRSRQIMSFQKLINIDSKKKRGRPAGSANYYEKPDKAYSELQSVQKARNVTSFFKDTPINPAGCHDNIQQLQEEQPVINPKILQTKQIEEKQQRSQTQTRQEQQISRNIIPMDSAKRLLEYSYDSSHHKLTPSEVLRSSLRRTNENFSITKRREDVRLNLDSSRISAQKCSLMIPSGSYAQNSQLGVVYAAPIKQPQSFPQQNLQQQQNHQNNNSQLNQSINNQNQLSLNQQLQQSNQKYLGRSYSNNLMQKKVQLTNSLLAQGQGITGLIAPQSFGQFTKPNQMMGNSGNQQGINHLNNNGKKIIK